MSVYVQWYDKTQRILFYEFEGTILWDDYLTALSQGRVMMQSVQHQVCVLNSMLLSVQLPDGFVTKVRTIIETEPDNRGCIVFISPSRSFAQMMDKVQRIIPKFDEYCFYADTKDEALSRIREWNNAQARTS
jgi:hypothetical protein